MEDFLATAKYIGPDQEGLVKRTHYSLRIHQLSKMHFITVYPTHYNHPDWETLPLSITYKNLSTFLTFWADLNLRKKSFFLDQ